MDSQEQEIHLKKVSTNEGETRVLVKSICRARKERAMDELGMAQEDSGSRN
ncbi:MAG: hypothetical protein HQL31_09415 [Planctomycetes bacterium]|nr:hypothetical protein [Planctomycetota bacterium]